MVSFLSRYTETSLMKYLTEVSSGSVTAGVGGDCGYITTGELGET
jgi:hypothetical protein